MSVMERRGLLPVGRIDDLPPLEATLICCLRLFYESEDARGALERSLAAHLGAGPGAALFAQLTELCEMTRRFSRRPLMRRPANCCAAGADECAFAGMVAAAAMGEREDAVCLIRPDVSPPVVALAEQVGLSLMPLVPALAGRDARRLH